MINELDKLIKNIKNNIFEKKTRTFSLLIDAANKIVSSELLLSLFRTKTIEIIVEKFITNVVLLKNL